MLAAYYTPSDIESNHYQATSDSEFPYHPALESLSYHPNIHPSISSLRQQLMSIQSLHTANPSIRVQNSSPFPEEDSRVQQQMLVHQPYLSGVWGSSDNLLSPSVYAQNSSSQKLNGRYHKRALSGSSVGSAGPPSPQDSAIVYPSIADPDSSIYSPSPFDSVDFFATARGSQMQKALPTPADTPIQNNFNPSDFHHFPSPHDAQNTVTMRRTHHGNRSPNHEDDGVPYNFSAPQSVSSASHHDSPATPQTYDTDYDDAAKNLQHAGYNTRLNNLNLNMPSVNLEDFYGSHLPNMPSQQQSQKMVPTAGGLSPFRTSLANRFQAAQLEHVASRTASPVNSIQREKSPFRPATFDANTQMSAMAGQRFGSHMAQYSQRPQMMNSTAMLGSHQQRAQHDQQVEQPKTVSPKDVELEYHEQDQTPLFPSSQASQFSLPREESNFSSVSGFGQPNHYYAPVASNQHHAPRYAFLDQQHRQQCSLHSNADQVLPDFPAHLTSMETTVSSESGADQSTPAPTQKPAPIHRPGDTSTGAGAYSCTSQGCTQRFDSSARLYKHKRDVHSQPSASVSPAASPAMPHPSSNHGHVASASTIASRNSQAGPHTCDRINPTTGKPCNSIFSRPYDLTRHEDTIHTGRKHKVRCHLCTEEKTFSRNDALTRHMRVVHPEVDWPGKTRRKTKD